MREQDSEKNIEKDLRKMSGEQLRAHMRYHWSCLKHCHTIVERGAVRMLMRRTRRELKRRGLNG